MTVQQTVASEIEEQIGYRVELSTDAGDVLSQYVPTTTLRARVYRGSVEVTDQIIAGRFRWTRASADETADRVWNDAHIGVKQIALTTADVFFSATYSCNISNG